MLLLKEARTQKVPHSQSNYEEKKNNSGDTTILNSCYIMNKLFKKAIWDCCQNIHIED